jgi:hypothetical protein
MLLRISGYNPAVFVSLWVNPVLVKPVVVGHERGVIESKG